jgi:hypothetical protein
MAMKIQHRIQYPDIYGNAAGLSGAQDHDLFTVNILAGINLHDIIALG